MLHRESTTQQEIRRLALGSTIPGQRVGMPAAHEVAGVLVPIAIEAVHRTGNGLAAQPMSAKFGADERRAITRTRATAHQQFGKAGVVLPARIGQLVDGRLGIAGSYPSECQLARQVLAGVLAPGQQAQRTLDG